MIPSIAHLKDLGILIERDPNQKYELLQQFGLTERPAMPSRPHLGTPTLELAQQQELNLLNKKVI